MMGTAEPVVIWVSRSSSDDHVASLADVLVATAAEDRSSELFARYPGVALVLVVGPDGEILACPRDGIVLPLGTAPPHVPPADWIAAVADFLYLLWAYGSE